MYKNLREINAKYTKKGQQRKFGKKKEIKPNRMDFFVSKNKSHELYEIYGYGNYSSVLI